MKNRSVHFHFPRDHSLSLYHILSLSIVQYSIIFQLIRSANVQSITYSNIRSQFEWRTNERTNNERREEEFKEHAKFATHDRTGNQQIAIICEFAK